MNKNVPKIRFVEFKEEWVQKKFSSIVNRISNQSSDPTLPKVEFEDIVSGEGILNKDISQKFDDRKGTVFEPNFILFGKLRPYLKNWLFPDFKGIALGDFWVFEANNSSPLFNFYLIQSDKYQNVANLSTGTKMPRSDWNVVSKTEFIIPSDIYEQQRIGEFFEQLDATIALQKKLIEQKQQYKKAMLQRMFPQKGETIPKVRFKEFDRNWAEIKMGDVFEQTNEYINPQESNIELFSLTVEKGLTQKTARYNREFLVKKVDKFKKVDPNEFVYNPMNMTLGAVGFNDLKSSVAVSGYYVTMKIKKEYDNEYFRIVLTSPQMINLYKLYATGSLIEKQRVQFPNFSQITIKVPVFKEQQKIGGFFKELDENIALHQKKLTNYQKLKKALLQKMFI